MNAFSQFALTIFLSFGTAAIVFLIMPSLVRAAEGQGLGRFVAWLPRLPDGVFIVMALAYVLMCVGLSISAILSMDGFLRDLAIYDQIVWNSLNGRLFESTLIPDATFYLGKTFAPILLALVPLYAIWSHPLVLAIVEVVAFTAGAFPIYWFARKEVGRPLALTLAFAYFLTPGIAKSNVGQFYEIVVIMPVLSLLMFFLLQQHYQGFLVCLGLALLFKEEMSFITIALGVFVFLVQRKRWLGLALMGFGATWAIVLFQYVMPFFHDAGTSGMFYYFSNQTAGGARYGYLGNNLTEIFRTILTRPTLVLSTVLQPERIEFVLYHFVPLVFIPLFAPEVAALTFPTFGYSLLSLQDYPYQIENQYRAPLIIFLFFATIIGLRRLREWQSKKHFRRSRNPSSDRMAQQGAIVTLFLVASTSMFIFRPGIPINSLLDVRLILNERSSLEDALLKTIPRDSVVVAQGEFLARLSQRSHIYEIPVPDYRQVDYLVADRTKPWYDVHRALFEYYLSTGYFQVVVNQDGFLIAKHRSPARVSNITYGKVITLIGSSLPMAQSSPWGEALRPVIDWRAGKTITESYQIEIQIIDSQGHVWAQKEGEPQDGLLPTNRWTPGKMVGDQYALNLPPTMPTGDYDVTVALHKPNSDIYLEARDMSGNGLGDGADVGTFHLEKNKKSFTASDLHLLNSQFVDMGEMRFLGYVAPRETLDAGELLQVGLYWRAREKPRGDYAVVVQLRDAAGHVAFEHANRPANGTYPTMQWDAGEVLLDWHDFNLPKDLTAGEYQIFVSLRDSGTGRMLGETKLTTIQVNK